MKRRILSLRTQFLLALMSALAACGKYSLGWPDQVQPRSVTVEPVMPKAGVAPASATTPPVDPPPVRPYG